MDRSTHVVSHVAHQARGEIQEHGLKIQNTLIHRGLVQALLGIGKDTRYNILNESLEIGIAKEAKPGLALNLPQFTISINNAIT